MTECLMFPSGTIAGGTPHPPPPAIYDAAVYRRRELGEFVHACQVAALRVDLLRLISKAPPEKRARLENLQRLLRAGATDALSTSFLRDARQALQRVEQIGGAQRIETRSLQMPVSTRAHGGDRVITFTVSTRALDRHGTRVEPMGIDTAKYEQNPVVLYAHDGYGGITTPQAENIIGRALRLRKSRERLEADIEFVPASVNKRAEMIFQLARGGYVNATSIGFIPREVKNETENGRQVPVITKSELLEISVVPIPSNPEALAERARVGASA